MRPPPRVFATLPCTQDPAWVLDKAYYPVRQIPDGRWIPRGITEDLIWASSIIPTAKQLREFERSPAYANMIFEVWGWGPWMWLCLSTLVVLCIGYDCVRMVRACYHGLLGMALAIMN
jgi:hypothetical protein